jgi:1-deoxy-D-xylulose-5-phosphate reductoisomerase
LKKNIAILGSTGSIGTQALEVVREHPDEFCIEVLTAFDNADLLIKQALEFKPDSVVIANDYHYKYVKESLSASDVKVYAGVEAIEQVVELENIDLVLTAMVGFSGLKPTLSAIAAGKQIALANKETLVVAGELVTSLAREKGVNIYPVDSEHSAIFQCLAGEFHNKVEKIYLTASGGPFRGKTRNELLDVTIEQALKHPNWSMGAKVTIDSATMMNKGLEVIEAKWLFGLKPEQIDVIVHPQSIVHSLVQFTDGSIKAQLGIPDMKLPIQYALAYPNRLQSSFPRLDFADYPQLTFEKPDTTVFRCLPIAFEAMITGGNMPCILNAANEVVVDAFIKGLVKFIEIPDIIQRTIQRVAYIEHPVLDDYLETDRLAREITKSLI